MTIKDSDQLQSYANKYQEVTYDQFDQMDALCTDGGELLKGIFTYGFEIPSQIQMKAITAMADGVDLIAQSQSGTGKTGAFTIGLLTKINPKEGRPQGIIIANTRELAMQIHYVITNISKFMNINISLCIGGTSGKDTKTNLEEASKSHILVGTPGRLVDLIERSNTSKSHKKLFDDIKILVLDEADALLVSDFLIQTQKILGHIPRETQVCIFSATYPNEILEITSHFMKADKVHILVKKENINLDLIKSYMIDVVEEKNKYEVLTDMYKNINICQAVIFINSIERSNLLACRLTNDGHSVGIIHSKMSDIERSGTLTEFRNMNIRVLIGTDIISRGIDIEQVGLVINYDIPSDEKQYIHRVGRSGRFHKTGVAINFVTKNDAEKIRNIETTYNIKISPLPTLDIVNHYLTGANGYSYITPTQ